MWIDIVKKNEHIERGIKERRSHADSCGVFIADRTVMIVKLVTTSAALFCLSQDARAMTLSEYSEQGENFKSGYVVGVMEALTLFRSGDAVNDLRSANLLRCIQENKINSGEAVKLVGRFILRSADASATPMLGIVAQALDQACAAYLQQ